MTKKFLNSYFFFFFFFFFLNSNAYPFLIHTFENEGWDISSQSSFRFTFLKNFLYINDHLLLSKNKSIITPQVED